MDSAKVTAACGRAVFAYTDEDTGLHFTWRGGSYIDVYADGSCVDCIGVWDHEHDTPTIARTLAAFEAECRDYLADEETC